MPHLAVNDVYANYGAVSVLHGIDFAVDRGEAVSLVGPSGSGKSTVLRALVGLTPVTGGHVEVDGSRINYGSSSQVRAARDRMAIVFQQYNLFQNMNVMCQAVENGSCQAFCSEGFCPFVEWKVRCDDD